MTVPPKRTPQDLPPEGGYDPIHISRIKLRTIMRAPLAIGLVSACTLGGFYLYSLDYKEVKRSEVELMSARLATYPMLLAERDRAVLKHMRKLREEEAKLMKNVEGWEVGTYYGEPIFMGDDPDTFHEPTFDEFFMHTPAGYTFKRVFQHLFV